MIIIQGQGKFELVVECISQNLDSDFSQLNISVFVTVQDVNDNAPVFDLPEYNITIKEELPKDTIVFTDFEATDRDQPGPNSFILYSIAPGPNSDLLGIPDPFRPVVTIKNRIDYEKIRSFDVILEARDQGEPSLSTSAPLHVTVEDVDDRPPYFRHQYYTCHTIKENDQLVVEPEAIKARDGDELDADIEYGIFGEFSNHFSIDNDGNIFVKISPPPPQATFFVYAYEKGNPEKNATAIVSLSLEKSIRFEHDSYSLRGAAVRYSLGNVNAVVSVGETTGQLTFAGLPKVKAGILQYELLATNRVETTKAKLTVVVETESGCCSRMEFEKQEYHLQMGSFPVIGTINVRGQQKPNYRLMNMNKLVIFFKKPYSEFFSYTDRPIVSNPVGSFALTAVSNFSMILSQAKKE
ncbi:cadherin domain protein [Teladorsagia circumcincta]|uniref:Cadherin domain protein n=1 Tax=Teladorsagia circumcincta TaxID=45464 RepID=A0A2G9V5E3_TELCI|nr:cadherin domain protein [Teladorsagia circumcincta]